MAISYPLTHPATPGFRSVTFEAVNIVGETRSEFTGAQIEYQWPGEWWEAMLELPPMTRAQAEDWLAFLTALRGKYGTFYLGPEKQARTIQGTAAGVTINGASQTGTTLALNGTGTLLAGDWLQTDSGSSARLYKNLTDATLATTIDIFPRLRSSPVNSSSVVISNPVGLFRLPDNRRGWNIDLMRLYGLSFKAVEAI